jgi:release factor glutamine methyltransferase
MSSNPPPTAAANHSQASLLEASVRWLAARGVAEPRIACELLAARILRLPRLQLSLERSRQLRPLQVAALRRGVLRLGTHEPVQYILSEWEFRGLTLKVDRRALIPRPETEQLVQRVLDHSEVWQAPVPRLADIGTGSGCIAISLATEVPRCEIVAVDREPAALELARENAACHNVATRIKFIQGEFCAGLPTASLDALVSNPPYIASHTCEQLPTLIRDFEPRSALDGGTDGLEVLRHLIPDAAMALKPHGWCFLEIGHDQGEAVRALLGQAGFTDITIARDLAGQIRFAQARIP